MSSRTSSPVTPTKSHPPSSTAPAPAPSPRSDGDGALGPRCQAWLRERHGLAFDRMEDPPTEILVGGGAFRAWKYDSLAWTRWAFASVCSLGVTSMAGLVAMRRLEPGSQAWVHGTLALAALVAAATAMVALRGRSRARRVVAVAWDRGSRPLKAYERTAIVEGLRARWPDAAQCWLLTLRPMGLPENSAGLRVIPVRDADLPHLSRAGDGADGRSANA